MVIHCMACSKLFYLDSNVEERACPACGSSDTQHVAMTIIFEQAANNTGIAPLTERNEPKPHV